MEGVRVEDGLDHDEGLGEVLPDEVVPVIGRLVGAVVEHLQEGRPPQVEHELQERGEEGCHHDRNNNKNNNNKKKASSCTVTRAHLRVERQGL